jgi:hypothetical protein
VYVEEMDVRPAHGRRRPGGRRLEYVCGWAEAQGHAAVTLSTFRDVPWTGPFYRKHGLRDLQPAEWTPGMRAIREQETRHGLAVEAGCSCVASWVGWACHLARRGRSQAEPVSG